jgi:hypothetical protein
MVGSITLYDSDGITPLSYPVSVSSGTFTFAAADLINPIVFTKDVYKTIFVKGNPTASSTAAGYYLTVAASTTDLILTGMESTEDATTTAFVLGNTVQGKYELDDAVLNITKNAASPSGLQANRAVTYDTGAAWWNISNPTTADKDITSIVLTSRSGLPSDIPSTNTTMFKLIDEAGTVVASMASSTSYAAATVTFDHDVITGGVFTIPAGSEKILKLLVETTDLTIWDVGKTMQWTVNAASDVTVTSGTIGWTGSAWSVRADTNVITLP